MGSPSSPPSSPLTLADADAVARDRFGLAALHPWQREAVAAVVDTPRRALVIAPTGGGKSLCYQLPALLLPGTAVVVSPLISLMEDQVRALTQRGIRATFLASTVPAEERSARLAGIRRGDYQLVYAAPERLVDGIDSVLSRDKISLLAIDEAHCVVHWGHDFRPDYLRIAEWIRQAAPPRLLACTATATPATRGAILRALFPDEANTAVILRGFARPNLSLNVREVSGPRQAMRCAHDALRESLGAPTSPRGAAIVYATTRKQTEAITSYLRTEGWRAQTYHAGIDGEERSACARGFQEKKLDVVVATNAFGMGIDRPDVRVVVHAHPPSSIESYYQEVGRAGRDGAPARGILCFAPADIPLRRRMIEMGSGGQPADAATQERLWGLFRDVLRYLDARSCRHDFILRYFGDESESLGNCGTCDVCRDLDTLSASDPLAEERNADLVRRALAGVARARKRAGLTAVADMLAGNLNARVEKFRFSALSTFGILRDLGLDGVMSVLRALVAAGYVDFTPGDFPLPYLTERGVRVMRGDEPAAVSLHRPAASPREARPSSPRREKQPRAAAPSDLPMNAESTARFEVLRSARAAMARELKLPPYVIAHDRALRVLALDPPPSVQGMRALPGWGETNVSKYGERLFQALQNGCVSA